MAGSTPSCPLLLLKPLAVMHTQGVLIVPIFRNGAGITAGGGGGVHAVSGRASRVEITV